MPAQVIIQGPRRIGPHAEKQRLTQGNHSGLGQNVPTDGQKGKDSHREQDFLPIGAQDERQHQKSDKRN